MRFLTRSRVFSGEEMCVLDAAGVTRGDRAGAKEAPAQRVRAGASVLVLQGIPTHVPILRLRRPLPYIAASRCAGLTTGMQCPGWSAVTDNTQQHERLVDWYRRARVRPTATR
jgi:hypothetical protein